ADPIHQPQCWTSEQSVSSVILDKNELFRHSRSLAQQNHGIIRMMKHINKHHCVEALVGARNPTTIELANRDARFTANQNIDPAQMDIRALILDQAREQSITTTNVQDGSARRNQRTQRLAQYSHASAMHIL